MAEAPGPGQNLLRPLVSVKRSPGERSATNAGTGPAVSYVRQPRSPPDDAPSAQLTLSSCPTLTWRSNDRNGGAGGPARRASPGRPSVAGRREAGHRSSGVEGGELWADPWAAEP